MPTPRRHYFLVADQLLHEPWPHDVKAALVMLMAYLHQRWARDGLTAEQACHAHLGRAEVALISGKHRPDVARKFLEHLADFASISVEHLADVTVIHWPKFAEFQGLPARNQPEGNPEPTPSLPIPPPDPQPNLQEKTSGDKRRGHETWLTPFGEVWKRVFGGELAWGEAGKVLKDPVAELGADEVLARFTRYCEGTEARYVPRPAKFASMIGKWARNGDQVGLSPGVNAHLDRMLAEDQQWKRKAR